jgi:hypothetical protein
MAKVRKKLKIKCTSSDCGSGLHCFKAKEGGAAEHKAGSCRECGANLVDWERIHSRNSKDVEHTFAMLKFEFVRHKFWHIALSEKAINHARRKGRTGIRDCVKNHLTRAIGPAEPWRDGCQTPMVEDAPNALAYAQHATATCCRKCVEYWHGIPRHNELTATELNYLTELSSRYFEDRIPSLTEQGEIIPPVRR